MIPGTPITYHDMYTYTTFLVDPDILPVCQARRVPPSTRPPKRVHRYILLYITILYNYSEGPLGHRHQKLPDPSSLQLRHARH